MADIPSAPGTPVETPPSPVSRVLLALAHRWPTWCGLLFMVFNALDMEDGRSSALIVFLAALIYLATAVVGRPGVVWPLFGISLVAVTLLRLLDVDPWPALVASAVSITVLGLVGGLLHKPWLTAAQFPAMLVFGAAALVALSMSPELGGYLVAAALIGHATLDVVVWRKGEVVTRSLAEFCAVLDFTLGVAILLLA
ncbi:hypothetical protein ACFLIM_33825 [Nonomuraea sp. M3C6]|uniref:YhhN-like protein n=1 Tax=Nonomuraea marmarensis TaxID=3351344 RepID=A0ABW7ALD3_9ACTN